LPRWRPTPRRSPRTSLGSPRSRPLGWGAWGGVCELGRPRSGVNDAWALDFELARGSFVSFAICAVRPPFELELGGDPRSVPPQVAAKRGFQRCAALVSAFKIAPKQAGDDDHVIRQQQASGAL